MKSPATPGTDGLTVRGVAIPAQPGVDFDLAALAGQGVTVSEDGNELIAEAEGTPAISQGKYTVSPALHIQSNVDFATGNVEFPGPVGVDGDVLDGFSVSAGADLTVKGVVQAASLQAGGNVVLMGGVLGNDRGSVVAQGDVRASFLQACTVKAGGDVLVNGEVIRCTIEAAGAVRIGGTGKIIGGSVKAGTQIEAKQIGSPAGVPTRVMITAQKRAGPSVQQGVTGAATEKEKEASRPSIRVSEMVHPPSEIVIGTARLSITTPTPFCFFTQSGTSIVMASYK